HQRIMQRCRNGKTRQRADGDVTISCVLKEPGLQHHFGKFFDEERNAVRLADDLLEYFGWQFLATRYISHHRDALVALKPVKLDSGYVFLIKPRRNELGSESDQEEHRHPLRRFNKSVGGFQG